MNRILSQVDLPELPLKYCPGCGRVLAVITPPFIINYKFNSSDGKLDYWKVGLIIGCRYHLRSPHRIRLFAFIDKPEWHTTDDSLKDNELRKLFYPPEGSWRLRRVGWLDRLFGPPTYR